VQSETPVGHCYVHIDLPAFQAYDPGQPANHSPFHRNRLTCGMITGASREVPLLEVRT